LSLVKVILSAASTFIWHTGINQGVKFRHSEGAETIPSAIYIYIFSKQKEKSYN